MKLVFTILAGRGLAPCISARYAYITHPYYVSMAQKFVWTPALTANYKNRALGNFSKLGLNHVRKEFVANDFWLTLRRCSWCSFETYRNRRRQRCQPRPTTLCLRNEEKIGSHAARAFLQVSPMATMKIRLDYLHRFNYQLFINSYVWNHFFKKNKHDQQPRDVSI